MNPLDTIVAPATPLARSALAIARIDGPESASILRALTGRDDFAERIATLTEIHHSGHLVDECVATRFAAPRSFTGNDLVELTMHGNPMIVQQVIAACVALGARIAEPGEFTERAVLNGKLDLVQAEAIADLVNARTPLQARLSLRQMGGRLSQDATLVREELLHVIARLEAALDFAEEGYDFIGRDDARDRLERARRGLRDLAETYRRGRATQQGISLVILGRPNAGKSTLLNRLVGSERAIVTPVPGTTRDIVTATIEIGGLPVTLADTAGLRASGDVVESIGVERARGAARAADVILYLIDSSGGVTAEDERELGALGTRVMQVWTKVDLAPAPPQVVGISAASGEGMAQLLAILDAVVREEFAVPETSAAIVNERQASAVTDAAAALDRAVESLEAGAEEQLVVVDLYASANALAALTGAISRDDVLSEIFAKFCIGK